MNEYSISFPVAKLANEKGFKKCNSEYLYDKKGDKVVNNPLDKFIWRGKYLIPTQSLLQKWLRDVHGINVNVDTEIGLMWIWRIQSLHPESSYTGDVKYAEFVYSTYEESLEVGLYEAIKLIVIK